MDRPHNILLVILMASIFLPQDNITRWVDVGADNYAGVTWSNIP